MLIPSFGRDLCRFGNLFSKNWYAHHNILSRIWDKKSNIILIKNCNPEKKWEKRLDYISANTHNVCETPSIDQTSWKDVGQITSLLSCFWFNIMGNSKTLLLIVRDTQSYLPNREYGGKPASDICFDDKTDMILRLPRMIAPIYRFVPPIYNSSVCVCAPWLRSVASSYHRVSWWILSRQEQWILYHKLSEIKFVRVRSVNIWNIYLDSVHNFLKVIQPFMLEKTLESWKTFL